MKLDAIQFWARHRPNAIALSSNGEITYRIFDQSINKVAAGLQRFDLPKSGIVAVQAGSLSYLYLIERALDRMGLTTAIAPNGVSPADLFRFLEPEFFLTFEEAHLKSHPKAALLSREWISDVMNGPAVPPPAYKQRPQDIIRIMLSSGTTGKPKKIPITRAAQEYRLSKASVGIRNGYNADERIVVTMGPDSVAGFLWPIWCWSTGGCVVNIDFQEIYREIVRLQPNNVFMSTGQMEALLKTIPDNAKPLDGVRFTVGGSPVTKPIALMVAEKLTKDFYIMYGSAELAAISFGHADVLNRNERAVGYVMAGRDVEVVDTDGTALPASKIGIVRIQQDEAFVGYLDEDDQTASSLRDGWFYPGDLGALSEDGLLVIVGRVSEIMNLGGTKIDPVLIDEFAKTIAGVRDAAAFSVLNDAGVEFPWIAVVRDESFDAAELRALVHAKWPVLSTVRLAFIDAIPRNGMMKVEREKLKRLIAAPQQ